MSCPGLSCLLTLHLDTQRSSFPDSKAAVSHLYLFLILTNHPFGTQHEKASKLILLWQLMTNPGLMCYFSQVMEHLNTTVANDNNNCNNNHSYYLLSGRYCAKHIYVLTHLILTTTLILSLLGDVRGWQGRERSLLTQRNNPQQCNFRDCS